MKGACFQGIEQVVLGDVPEPQIQQPTDAIVRVSMAGLCGSDLHPFHGREVGLDAGTVMGHEMVGEVVQVGADVSGVNVGERVFTPFSTNCGHCFYCKCGLTSRCTEGQLLGWVQDRAGVAGCQSEFVRIPLAVGTLKRIPDEVSDVAALLLGDNFSTGFYCAEMAGIQPGGTYVVIGCGTVGLLCIVAAKSMGAETIYAIDPVAERRSFAESLGAIGLDANEAAVHEVRLRTEGRGADAVMELVGIPAAQQLAYQMLRPGGSMSVIGCHCTPNFSFSPIDAYDKNLTYRTGRCPARFYMDRLTDLVAQGNFDLEPFVTHRFGIDECTKAYDVFAHRKDGCLKAVLEF